MANDSCWDHFGNARSPLDAWQLEDRKTVCRCSVFGKVSCKTFPRPVCLDDKKTAQTQGRRWFMDNCTNCTCMNGNISCTQFDIKAFYGRFVVKKKVCYPNVDPVCVTSNKTNFDCQGESIATVFSDMMPLICAAFLKHSRQKTKYQCYHQSINTSNILGSRIRGPKCGLPRSCLKLHTDGIRVNTSKY